MLLDGLCGMRLKYSVIAVKLNVEMFVLSVRSFRKDFIIMSNSKKKSDVFPVSIKDVEDYVVVIRGVPVIADADVAALYGVETKRVNEAVRNNPDKFPLSYSFELNVRELRGLRTKISSTNVSTKNRNATRVFSERGLYMLATILNGKRARDVTFAIIETFFKVRSLKRDLLKMHAETDKNVQTTLMKQFGEVLTEINFLIGKLKHSVKRVKKLNNDK